MALGVRYLAVTPPLGDAWRSSLIANAGMRASAG